MTQVRDCNKDLEHYAEYKKMAQEKERTLKSLNQDKDELGEQLNEMEEELKPLKEKQKEIDQIASGFSDIQNKYTEGIQDFFWFSANSSPFYWFKNCFFLAKTSLEIHNKQVEDTRKSLGKEELSDKTEEEILTMKDDMATEEKELNQTREKLAR